MMQATKEQTPNFFYAAASWKPANKTPHNMLLSGEILDPKHVGMQFETLPDNQPATNGNLVAIWQNVGIPYGQAPVQKKAITNNQQSGDQIFEFQIQRKPYVCAYGTSDTGTAWAGAVQFTPGSTEGVSFVTEIDLTATGNDSLLASFITPKGNNPVANKNWIGLWEGPSPNYDGTNLIKKVDVTDPNAAGSQSMSGLKLLMNTTYSLAYAVGPKSSDLAAWITFTTQPF